MNEIDLCPKSQLDKLYLLGKVRFPFQSFQRFWRWFADRVVHFVWSMSIFTTFTIFCGCFFAALVTDSSAIDYQNRYSFHNHCATCFQTGRLYTFPCIRLTNIRLGCLFRMNNDWQMIKQTIPNKSKKQHNKFVFNLKRNRDPILQ